jgi:hypothetical protein
MPRFTIPCGVGFLQKYITLKNKDSEFEVQTEGGIATMYTINVSLLNSTGVLRGTISLNHSGPPTLVINGSGFSIQRTAGPNRYGEQNFRIGLPARATATTTMIAQAGGNKNAQFALRWGRPNHTDRLYFPIWKVSPDSSSIHEIFRITDPTSEFEIQTEGGYTTTYTLNVWFDFGQGKSALPSIKIQKLTPTAVNASIPCGSTVSVKHSPGNVYGEINVQVTAPDLPGTGFGEALSCN